MVFFFQALHKSSKTIYFNQTILKQLSNDGQSISTFQLPPVQIGSGNIFGFRERDDVNKNLQFIQTVQLERKVILVDGPNLLGFGLFICILGLTLSFSEGDKSTISVVKVASELDIAFQKITRLIFCYSPIGLGFVVCGTIMQVENINDSMMAMKKYLICVSLAFSIHTMLIFVIYIVATRKNPVHVFTAVAEVWLSALIVSPRSVFHFFEKNYSNGEISEGKQANIELFQILCEIRTAKLFSRIKLAWLSDHLRSSWMLSNMQNRDNLKESNENIC